MSQRTTRSHASVHWTDKTRQPLGATKVMSRFFAAAQARGLDLKIVRRIDAKFPVKVTREYANLIDKDDPNDPLLRIVFPDKRELDEQGLADQSGERLNTNETEIKGLQHKYRATVLFMISGICRSNCRYCFRRRTVGTINEVVSNEDLQRAFDYVRAHSEVTNVLLTGGDAFMASNGRIVRVLEELDNIDHVRIVRFGTKMPVYLPRRFDDEELMGILRRYQTSGNQQLYVITHVDHPQELGEDAITAHRKLAEIGTQLRSQTVLANGLNNDPKILAQLFSSLAGIGITPYYIFQPRPVRGASHFALPLLEGYRAVSGAKSRDISGLAKTAAYVMSHVSGKLEILSVVEEGENRTAILKYRQARDPDFAGSLMILRYGKEAFWLDDIFAQSHEVLEGQAAVDYAKQQAALLVA